MTCVNPVLSLPADPGELCLRPVYLPPPWGQEIARGLARATPTLKVERQLESPRRAKERRSNQRM